MGGGGHYGPYRFFLCCVKTVCSKKNETFRLLVSTYWASENVILNHLGLNSLPWQPYCKEVFAAHLGKITKVANFKMISPSNL